MIWSRKQGAPNGGTGRLAGLDLTASRARAVAVAGGQSRPVRLDDAGDELPLCIAIDGRSAGVGLAGYAHVRARPHLVCANFLSQLGQPREWRGPRLTLTPEKAVAATFDRLRGPLAAAADAVAVALPTYLSEAQAKAVRATAERAKLPVAGTAAAPLAVVAHRAGALTAAPTADPDGGRPDWVVPIRPADAGPACVVVADADEFALTLAVVSVDRGEARLLAHNHWPKASLKAWADRLIDALSDRCVRLCRRDPRDSADAEQALFEQLDPALARVRSGRPATLTVRTDRWYQDITVQPADLDAACQPLAKLAADALLDVLSAAAPPVPPRAVWLTDAAARLPGLSGAVYRHSAENTAVAVLPPDAVAEAAAALVARGLLGAGHLDQAVSVPVSVPVAKTGTGTATSPRA